MCKTLSFRLARLMLTRVRRFYISTRWSPTNSPTSLSEIIDSIEIAGSANFSTMEKITLNTRVTILDLQENQTCSLTLVAPPASQPEQGCISILSMLGSQLMGKREGDMVVIAFFGTTMRYRILKVN
ncbi:GreA/GreB family elongation factor [Simiduia curdlanivorans]|uniref:GreA/GreB family elongation factor n=1 Tax=Simiduia curdlanivorans TaxID=1492769 RepID=A0ABV8V348_9GAMM|nr:GreA/GreB family elongation factor [Simiduia curdlanivorans]MDN3637486.1 GreA/GreB family elongation factor [Simiduia curdlanivorans]